MTALDDLRADVERVHVWHDEHLRYERTGRLDQGPCWCPDCLRTDTGHPAHDDTDEHESDPPSLDDGSSDSINPADDTDEGDDHA